MKNYSNLIRNIFRNYILNRYRKIFINDIRSILDSGKIENIQDRYNNGLHRLLQTEFSVYIIHIDDPSNITSYSKEDGIDLYDNKLGENTLGLSLYISSKLLKRILNVISTQTVLKYLSRLESLGDKLNIKRRDLILRYISPALRKKYNMTKGKKKFNL